MKCQNHTNCGDYCETAAEISVHMCGNCLESDKQREDDVKNLVELSLAMDLIRSAAGLSENLTAHEVACKVAERLAHLDNETSRWKPFKDAPKNGDFVDLSSKIHGRLTDCYFDKQIQRWIRGAIKIKTDSITHYMIVNPPKE